MDSWCSTLIKTGLYLGFQPREADFDHKYVSVKKSVSCGCNPKYKTH